MEIVLSSMYTKTEDTDITFIIATSDVSGKLNEEAEDLTNMNLSLVD